MNQFEIKKLLAENGFNLLMLAEALGKSKVSVGLVISRKMTSTEIAKAVAKAIGKEFYDVFPEYQEITPKIRPLNKDKAEKMKKLQQIIG